MKIAIVRGENLNKFEIQNYEPLGNKYDITAYTTYNHRFEIDKIDIPVKKLHCPEEFTQHLPLPFRYCFDGVFYKLGYASYMFGLEKELKNMEIAHVAETFNGYSYQAIKAKEKHGTKVVVTVWENIPFRSIIPFPRFLDNDRLRNKVRENADVFIAITNRAKEALILEGVKEEKIHVTPIGVNLSRFKPRKKDKILLNKLGLNENDFVILFIGRLTWQKGIYDIIYAAKMILKDTELRNISTKFLFTGDGPEKENMKNVIKKLELSKNVKLIGTFPYHEIHKLYNLADIFVLPSIPAKGWQEQFGIVLVEAMASGVVAISTLSGSVPEVVNDAGILTQPNNPLSLYNEIKKLILNRELREELRKKARNRAEKEFDSEKIAIKIGKIYEDL